MQLELTAFPRLCRVVFYTAFRWSGYFSRVELGQGDP